MRTAMRKKIPPTESEMILKMKATRRVPVLKAQQAEIEAGKNLRKGTRKMSHKCSTSSSKL